MMRYLNFIICLISICLISDKSVFAQKIPCTGSYDSKLHQFVYTFESVEEMPEFPGGVSNFFKFISAVSLKNITNERIQSTIFPSFIIDAEGNVIDIGINGKQPKYYTQLDKNMINLLKTCPKWKPAKCNGKNVAIRYRARLTLCYQ